MVVSVLSVKTMISGDTLVRKVDDEEMETVVYEPTGSVTNSDDDVRISSIQFGVVRCSHIAVRSSMFHAHMRREIIN